uniref:Ig-like domain-containing protein n=1 Tax=Oryzias latipes TaxID=8090 RepID=A0A3P9ICL1_ORYLA
MLDPEVKRFQWRPKRAGWTFFVFPGNTQTVALCLQSGMVCSPSTVQAHLGRDVVLSCPVEPPYDLTNETLEWTNGTNVVHVYRSRKDDPDNQDLRFKGRTILNHQNLKDGIVSLTLTNVLMSLIQAFSCSI